MGAAYNILGKQVQPQNLALLTIASVVGGVLLATSGDKPAEKAAEAAPAAAAASGEAGKYDIKAALAKYTSK